MQNTCLLEAFGGEIDRHTLGSKTPFSKLLELIGAGTSIWEFWGALTFKFNSKIALSRDPDTHELLLTQCSVIPLSNPGESYEYDRAAEYGRQRFYVPPIPADVLTDLVLTQGNAEEPVKTIIARIIAKFPEMQIFNAEEMVAQVIMPCLRANLKKLATVAATT